MAHDIQKQTLPPKQEETPLHNLYEVGQQKCDSQDSSSFPIESISKPEEKSEVLRCEKSDINEQTCPHGSECQQTDLSQDVR